MGRRADSQVALPARETGIICSWRWAGLAIDWRSLTAAEVRSKGTPAFSAGGLQRFYFGPGNRYLVDLRQEAGTEVVDRAFDIQENRTAWPLPKGQETRPALRRIQWDAAARKTGAQLRITLDDLERLQAALAKSDAGYIDVPLRMER